MVRGAECPGARPKNLTQESVEGDLEPVEGQVAWNQQPAAPFPGTSILPKPLSQKHIDTCDADSQKDTNQDRPHTSAGFGELQQAWDYTAPSRTLKEPTSG